MVNPIELRHDHHGCRLCVQQRAAAADHIEELEAELARLHDELGPYDSVTVAIDDAREQGSWDALTDAGRAVQVGALQEIASQGFFSSYTPRAKLLELLDENTTLARRALKWKEEDL